MVEERAQCVWSTGLLCRQLCRVIKITVDLKISTRIVEALDNDRRQK